MDALTLFMFSLVTTAFITVAAFLCATYFALRRRFLLAIICLGCFALLIRPEAVIR